MAAQIDVSGCLRHLRRLTVAEAGKVVCHAEGEEGVMSALILFERRGKVVLRFPDKTLVDALLANWNASERAGNAWAAFEITIENGKTATRFFTQAEYATPLIEDRIPRLVKAHFGATEWDDSDPWPDAAKRPWWRLW